MDRGSPLRVSMNSEQQTDRYRHATPIGHFAPTTGDRNSPTLSPA
jgi:hypothetical protein